MEARRRVAEWEPFSPGDEQGEDMDFQFSMDVLGGYNDVIRSPRFNCSGMKGSGFRNPLTKLVESMNEDNDDDEDRKESSMHSSDRIPSAGFNPPSVHRTTGSNGSVNALNRSADEQLPSSMSFVRLSDMSAEEWHAFIEKFQELLKKMLDELQGSG